jgi:hypothetical protein
MARGTAPKLTERRRVGFGGIPLDTPPLAVGSFIGRRGISDERKIKCSSALPKLLGELIQGMKSTAWLCF